MGQIRFIAPRRDRVSDEAIQRAYMAGMEQIPWHCRTGWSGNEIVIERNIDESGCLFVTWDVEGHGTLILSTTSLMQREQPYNLPLELARGTINRIRNQLAIWQPQGFTASESLEHELQAATEQFIAAATSQDEPVNCADRSEVAMKHAVNAIKQLGGTFANQVLSIRHQQTQKLPTLMAGSLDSGPLTETQSQQFQTAFNMAALQMNWHDIELNEGEHDWAETDQQVEWARKSGLKVCAGPLLRFTQRNLPDWIYLWDDDFESVRQYALSYVEEVVKRYRGSVHIWHCAAGMNLPGAIKLPEEYKLKLTVDAIQTVIQADTRAPVIVSFDQPWAEYLASQDLDLSPLHFADALVRADLGVAGIGLEINLGYWPNGTLPRDALEINRLIDHWGHLGLPLLIFLTVPSSDETDAHARRQANVVSNTFPGGVSLESQQETVRDILPLLLSKQSVHAVVWNQMCDDQPHDFPHGGMFDAEKNAKPALQMISQVRQKHLS